MSNQLISVLYDSVLCNDVHFNGVTQSDIRAAIENMTEVYKAHPYSLAGTEKRVADFNTVAHRCAYLHKYAPVHSAIVRDVLQTILKQDDKFFNDFYRKLTSYRFKICSLGGGPGSDIVGLVAALSDVAVFQSSVKVVDLKGDWADTLRSVVAELRSRDYGVVGQCFQPENFNWEYLTADLLTGVERVTRAISEADWVTMVKFVSAASCKNTESMLMKIFKMMKSGAMVLFVDNACGGFSELVSKVSKKCQMKYIFGPIDHKLYTNEDLRVSLCGYTSCFQTRVTIHVMQKQGRNKLNQISGNIPIWERAPNLIDLSGWVTESNAVRSQACWDKENLIRNQSGWDLIEDRSGWVRESNPIISQLRWDTETNLIVDQSRWVMGSNHLEAHSRWIAESLSHKARWDREFHDIENQSNWGTEAQYSKENLIVDQSRWVRESNPIVSQTSWDRENLIEDQGWVRESNPIISQLRSSQSKWDREFHDMENQLRFDTEQSYSQSKWDSEFHDIESQSDWGTESNYGQSRWDRDFRDIESQSSWDTEPHYSQSVWDREFHDIESQSSWDRVEQTGRVRNPYSRIAQSNRNIQPNRILSQVRGYNELNATVARSRWGRKPNPIVTNGTMFDSAWYKKTNPLVARPRWGRKSRPLLARPY